MRPSIAAALSTLGPIHSADTVLLTSTDVDRFADVEGPTDGRRRVIERPDGSLILMLEFEDDNFGLTYAFVGAVPAASWAWADPTKRASKLERVRRLGVFVAGATSDLSGSMWDLGTPLARVNLDARDIHCLTQGGEIHRGATVGTTTDGRAALQAATRPLTFAGIDLRPSMQAFPGFWATALSIKPAVTINLAGSADPEKVIAAWNGAAERMNASGRTPIATRTPKDGDRLDSFTAAELDALPVGARFELSDFPVLERTADGWRKGSHATYPHTIVIGSQDLGHRTLVLPKPAEAPKPAASPKVGDRLRDLTPEQRANLPIGTVLAPDEPGKPTMTKGVDGKWRDAIYATPLETQWLNFDRPILSLPTPPPAAPKVGDRWGNLTPEQHAALPVGTVIKEEGCITVAVWTRLPSGWSRVVVRTQNAGLGWVDAQEPTDPSVIASLPVSK